MPQGTNRIWYLMVILSHNNLFIPHWHYTLIYGLSVQNITFVSETIYLNHAFYLTNRLSVHTIWHIWIQDPRHNLYHWVLPHIKDIVDGYLMSIPIWHNLSRSIHFSSFSRYLTFCDVLWSIMSMCYFIALASLSWPYWSFAPSFFKEFYIWDRWVYYASGVSLTLSLKDFRLEHLQLNYIRG